MMTNWTLTMPGGWGGPEVLGSIARLVGMWQARARERAALARLDDRMLRDVGIDRATAHYEASKPFWQA